MVLGGGSATSLRSMAALTQGGSSLERRPTVNLQPGATVEEVVDSPPNSSSPSLKSQPTRLAILPPPAAEEVDNSFGNTIEDVLTALDRRKSEKAKSKARKADDEETATVDAKTTSKVAAKASHATAKVTKKALEPESAAVAAVAKPPRTTPKVAAEASCGKAKAKTKAKAKADGTTTAGASSDASKGKPAALVLGCSKCRWSVGGCGQCRDPAFGGHRWNADN